LKKAGSYIKYKFPYAGEEKWEGHFTVKDGDKTFMHELPSNLNAQKVMM